MERYQDSVVINGRGSLQAMPGALVYVYQAGTSVLSTLYSDAEGTVQVGNPLTADSDGEYAFYAQPGLYDITAIIGSLQDTKEAVRLGIGAADVTTFGAVGDGVTDDTAAIQAAITASYGKTLRVPKGTYLLTDYLSITDSITLDMDPEAILDYNGAAGTALNQRRAIYVAGSLGATTAITSDVAIGDRQIAFDTSTFAVDEWVIVKSAELFMDGVSGTTNVRGHITRIKSIDSGTAATMTERSPFAYASSSTAVVQKMNTVTGVTIRGGQIHCSGVGYAHSGISALCTIDLMVDGVGIYDAEDCGVQARYDVSTTVQNCRIERCTSPGGSVGNTGYGVCFFGSKDGQALYNRFLYCRHPISGGGPIISMHCLIRGNTAEDGGIGTVGYDCHEPCFWWTFDSNRTHGGQGGILIRGQYARVTNNDVQGVEGRGIHVRSYVTNPNGISGTYIAGNKIYGCGVYGIGLEGLSTTERIYETTITDNEIIDCEFFGVFAEFVDGLRISGGRFGSTRNSDGTNGSAIRTDGTVAGDCLNIEIDGAMIFDQPRYGIDLRYTNHVRINATIYDIQIDGINLTYTDDVRINGRIWNVGIGTSNSSAIFLDHCNGVTIDGGRYEHENTSTRGIIHVVDSNNLRVMRTSLLGKVTNVSQHGIRWYIDAAASNSTGTFIGNFVELCGGRGIYTTDSNRIVAVGNDCSNADSSAKMTFENATDVVQVGNFPDDNVLSPSQITGDQNNYDPSGLATSTVLRLSSDASRNITGLARGWANRKLVVANVGTQDLVFVNVSGSSTAENRFAFGADVTLQASESMALWYDGTSARWRCVGKHA